MPMESFFEIKNITLTNWKVFLILLKIKNTDLGYWKKSFLISHIKVKCQD